MEINQELLEKIADYFTIIHHTPGRIRLRASAKLKQEIKASEGDVNHLMDTLKNSSFIKDVSFNIIVGSVTIQYDKTKFDSSLWESWLKKERLDEIQAIIKKII